MPFGPRPFSRLSQGGVKEKGLATRDYGEAQMCIDKLRQYIQAQEDASHFFSSLDALDKYLDNRKGLMMQSKITDFFKSK